MSPLLKDYLRKRVVIITVDGHTIVGTLEGFDKSTNLFLSQCRDNYESDKQTEQMEPLAIQICRGSEIVCCGVIEEDTKQETKEETTEEETAKEKKEDALDLVNQWPMLRTTKNIVKDEHLIWQKVWTQLTNK